VTAHFGSNVTDFPLFRNRRSRLTEIAGHGLAKPSPSLRMT